MERKSTLPSKESKTEVLGVLRVHLDFDMDLFQERLNRAGDVIRKNPEKLGEMQDIVQEELNPISDLIKII